MNEIRIDRSKTLAEEPDVGHNRFYPGIEPVLEVGEGEEVVIETRDALDGQLLPPATTEVISGIDTGVVHPLTGPVAVKGAEPGDALEIEFLDIELSPPSYRWCCAISPVLDSRSHHSAAAGTRLCWSASGTWTPAPTTPGPASATATPRDWRVHEGQGGVRGRW